MTAAFDDDDLAFAQLPFRWRFDLTAGCFVAGASSSDDDGMALDRFRLL